MVMRAGRKGKVKRESAFAVPDFSLRYYGSTKPWGGRL